MKLKNIIIGILVILILIIVAITSVAIFNFSKKNDINNKFTNDKPDTVITSLLQSLNKSFPSFNFSKKNTSQWWISDDGWNIIDKNAIMIASSKNTFTKNDISPLNFVNKELNGFISTILLDNGFTPNMKNTSKTEKEFYDYILAFQKNETRCILKVNMDNGNYSVSCSDRFKEAYNEQIPYLKGLNLKDGVIYGIGETIDSFVKVDIAYRRTGHFKILKKGSNKMEVIFSGQESPPCLLMKDKQVPKEIYRTCLSVDGYIVK